MEVIIENIKTKIEIGGKRDTDKKRKTKKNNRSIYMKK